MFTPTVLYATTPLKAGEVVALGHEAIDHRARLVDHRDAGAAAATARRPC